MLFRSQRHVNYNHVFYFLFQFYHILSAEFTSEFWKYESFKCYNYIYIDINSKIYKINPNNVKSHMIDVENPKSKNEFIQFLNNGIDIWSNEEPQQCNLYIKQQGAGNGKTFGIIKMLEDDDKSHYKNFIYITKQHSAKHIIKATFEEIKNSKNNQFHYLKNIEITESNKKYIISYFNEKSNLNCKIIIATIDSFTYSIGNKNHTDYDKFQGLIYSIVDGYIESKSCGSINFASVNPKLNKETLLVIDEFQDPPEYYGKAIVQIMRNKYIDVYIVGDKLQSISNEKNAFTYFLENEFPSINIIKLEPANICRRFSHPELVNFVNHIIPFKKYNLPEIKPYTQITNNAIINPLIFIKGKFIDTNIKNDKNEEKITEEVEKIMLHYKKEVYNNNRFPEDFLIVTPFTNKNPLVDALQFALNIFWKNWFVEYPDNMALWKNKLQNIKNTNLNMSEKDKNNLEEIINFSCENDYYRFAVFHKSEDGSSIDLTESEYATRIVSCHTSKGDGRNVVFTIGFNESAIKKFSQTSNNLVYNSLIHVAFTRMKQKLYVYYIDDGDDISEKIKNFILNNYENKEDIIPILNIKDKVKYKDLFCENTSINFNLLYESIIKDCKLEKLENNSDEKIIIDMGNHAIRYSSLYITMYLEIINKEILNKSDNVKKQLKAILHNVSNSKMEEATSMKDYYILMQHENEKKIPIIKLSNLGKDYLNYFQIIKENITNIQNKLKIFLNNDKQMQLCPLECIILHYIIEIVENKQYSNISIQDLYNIIDIYNNSYSSEYKNCHTNCLCNKHFNTIKNVIPTKKINNMKLYLLKHFEKINDIKNKINMLYLKYPKINWLVNSCVKYEGNDDFIIYNKFNFIGYNDSHVFICYLKPQFNQLNYNDVLVNSIYDTHILHNIQQFNSDGKENNVYNNFNGKKIITCVFSLDLDKPYYIEWNKNDIDIIKNEEGELLLLLYNGLNEKYKSENISVFKFYSYWREFCPENEKKPTQFIRFLKKKLEGMSKPKYIDNFFTKLECRIELAEGKTNKENVLKKFDNKNEFFTVHELTSIKSHAVAIIKSYDFSQYRTCRNC